MDTRALGVVKAVHCLKEATVKIVSKIQYKVIRLKIDG